MRVTCAIRSRPCDLADFPFCRGPTGAASRRGARGRLRSSRCRCVGATPADVRHRRAVAAAARRPGHPGLPDLRRALRQPRSALRRVHGARRACDRATTTTRSTHWIDAAARRAGDRARRRRRRSTVARPRLARRPAAAAAARRTARDGARPASAATACARRVAGAARAAGGAVARDRASSSGRIRSACSTCCGAQLGGTQAGSTSASREGGYVTADRREPPGHRAAARPPYDTDVLARARPRCSSASRRRRQRRRATARSPDEDPLPPLQVEFAGGHRIAVETEAVVRRESILNTRRLARADPAAAVPRLPQRLARRASARCRRRCRCSSSSARSGSPAPRCRRRRPASAAMLFGLGVDGVVLLYVAHTLRSGEGRRRRQASTI